MTALRTLRRAHDRLVICAETSEDLALVREMDAAIEQVAAAEGLLAEAYVKHAAALIAVITHPRIRFAPPSEDLIAANAYGEMPHPVCQEDSGE